jgi:hypothetical protein
MRHLFTLLVILCLACNTASDLRRWYAPTDETTRAQKLPTQVAVFETEPADRHFAVIGIFAPPAEAFQSIAEAINGARSAAALYGADAVIVDTTDIVRLERISILEPTTGVHFKARAIVWR